MIKFLKNRIFISIVGLLFLSLIIWFVGPLIKFGDNNVSFLSDTVSRLIAIIVVIVLWGANNLRTQLRDNTHDRALLDGLQDKSNKSFIDPSSEQSSEEINQIKETFSQALATLKKIKFTDKGRRKALYELPWYIIIGPPGAGKTTALINSSLEFPLAEQFGKGAVQGVGGTRYCDWWFTNEAVLIDTAGRYTTQDSHKIADSTVWLGFLELLKKKRSRRPINGVIIAISMQDLMEQTDNERTEHAKIIRTRIDELMDTLGIRFPIYLMLTKSDVVAGFSEYFEDLTREEREQVWGISLPNTPNPSEAPDFELLNEEYIKLLGRLYERVIWRVNNERDIRRRGMILNFPQQMESMGSSVHSFIQQVFTKNRFQNQPYLRGLYFCSGTQDGTSIDRLMTSISNNFGISSETVQSSRSQGKSYFLGDLFRKVIFPESELVGSNRRYERLIRWSQLGSYLGLATIVIVVSLIWLGIFGQHTLNLNQVEVSVGKYDVEARQLSPSNLNIEDVLPALNALNEASAVYNNESHPWLSGLGLYDPSVDISADAAYQAQLKELYLPRVINYLEDHLKRGNQDGDLYNSFRIYLMFNKLEHMDKKAVQEWFSSAWGRDLNGRGTVHEDLKKHLSALLDTDIQPVELNAKLVNSVRTLLLRIPISQRIYSRIRNNPEYINNIDMFNNFGEPVRKVFIINPDVQAAVLTPYLFTQEGYKSIDISPRSGIVKEVVNDSWALSDNDKNSNNVDKSEVDEVSEKVKEYYLSEYNNHWRKLYEKMVIAPFKDVKHANDVLTTIVDPVSSPILSILQEGANNTQLSNSLLGEIGEKLQSGKAEKAAEVASSFIPQTIVDKQFRDVNALLKEQKNSPAPINETIQKIRQLQEFVNELASSPDPSKQAFEFTKSRYLSGQGGAIVALHVYAKAMPQPVRGWLDSLADQTWKVVLQSAHQHINAEWKSQVYMSYNRALTGRYPLYTSAGDEVAMADFSQFFKPGGTIDKFNIEYLQAFIDPSGRWKNKNIDGRTLGLSNNLLEKLNTASQIRKIFFRENAETPGLTFQLRPLQMGKNDAKFTFELGQQTILYSHGPKLWRTIQWLGDGGYSRARIIFEGLDGSIHSSIYEGPWAWFRLHDKYPIEKTSRSDIFKINFWAPDSTVINSEKSISYEIKADSVNNPFGKDLLGSFRCPESI